MTFVDLWMYKCLCRRQPDGGKSANKHTKIFHMIGCKSFGCATCKNFVMPLLNIDVMKIRATMMINVWNFVNSACYRVALLSFKYIEIISQARIFSRANDDIFAHSMNAQKSLYIKFQNIDLDLIAFLTFFALFRHGYCVLFVLDLDFHFAVEIIN